MAAPLFCGIYLTTGATEVNFSFIWVASVRPYQIFPKRRMIPHPCCALCDADMWLTCIEPDKPGHDRRTFECPRCQYVTVEVVNYGEQNE